MSTTNAADFWRRWAPWRHGDPGEGNFTDMMRVLGLYHLFAQFIAKHVPFHGPIQVLDLGCGAAPLAGPLARAFKAREAFLERYVGLDFADPAWMPLRVHREFVREEMVERGHYIHHDLAHGLPELGLGPEPLVMTSCWCMTYLGPERVGTLLRELMALTAERSGPKWLFLNMLTGGRFDRKVLTKKFLGEVVPRQIAQSLKTRNMGPARDLRLAIRALPRMRAFGDDLAAHVQLMTVPQVIQIVEEAGCHVESVDASALWGQTTSLAISLASS